MRSSEGPTLTSRVVGRLAEAAGRLSGGVCADVALEAPTGAAGSPTGTAGARAVPVLRVCAGAGRLTCARGGTTYGEVFVTRSPLSAVGPLVVRHELVHVRQWRRLGLALPVLYLLSGADPLRNRFEQQAGLRDGGYVR